MATDIVIPEAGESVVTGVLTSWLKPDGAYVERDDVVAEIETDKITIELNAPASGQLKHGASEGDELDIGAVVGSIDESAEAPTGSGGSGASESEVKSESGGGTATATKKEMTKSDAKAPDKSDDLSQAAKTAPTGGVPRAGASNGSAAGGPASGPTSNGSARATPVAEKLAAEHGIDLSTVRPTGPGGRIREQDVLAAMQVGGRASGSPATSTPTSASREISHERMSPLRQRIASRLVEAQQTAAMLTTFNEVDMTNVMALRSRHKEQFGEKHGIGLGFMSFFVRAVTKALEEFPDINSYLVAGEGGKPAIQRHNYCDVAIAVSAPKGLVVPVIRDAQSLSFAEIEKAIKDFAVRAKDNKLELSEMEGGTFTITNGGVFGSLLSTPILNPPQSAILGMHGIKKRAVEHPDKPGEIALRPMMYLALSYDHRMVDGAGAVQFLVSIKNSIEDPARLLLDL